MISTSSYNNFKTNLYKTVSISGDCGKQAKYEGRTYKQLAPKKVFWQIWHNNIGNISEEENNKYYIEQYFKQVLSSLDPEEISEKLNYSTLLCYESHNEFCHRHIVASWLELFLEEEVPELKMECNQIIKVDRPLYIKETLEKIIKENTNMRGFNSIRALYLFLKGVQLEKLAEELEKKTNKCYDDYRQQACFLRCEADKAEYQYNKNHKQKLKHKLLVNQ